MDILHLVDRLEELFNEGFGIPLTHNVIVDEDRMLDLIDQMRVAIPEEVKKSQQVMAQRDRILAQSKEEANRTIGMARDKGTEFVEQSQIVQAAKVRASEIEAQAHEEAEKTRHDADEYVIQTLSRLEAQLERALNQARNGIYALQNIEPEITETEPTDSENQE